MDNIWLEIFDISSIWSKRGDRVQLRWRFSTSGEFLMTVEHYRWFDFVRGQLDQSQLDKLINLVNEIRLWLPKLTERDQWIEDGEIWSITVCSDEQSFCFRDLHLDFFPSYKEFEEYLFGLFDYKKPKKRKKKKSKQLYWDRT